MPHSRVMIARAIITTIIAFSGKWLFFFANIIIVYKKDTNPSQALHFISQGHIKVNVHLNGNMIHLMSQKAPQHKTVFRQNGETNLAS